MIAAVTGPMPWISVSEVAVAVMICALFRIPDNSKIITRMVNQVDGVAAASVETHLANGSADGSAEIHWQRATHGNTDDTSV
jgi:hypothetical protein